MAGRWQERIGGLGRRRPGATGLARWTYPAGRLLDRIPSDLVLASPPCWSPDRSDRVVFAAADGRLYRLDFRDAGDLDGEMEEPRPREIRWATPPAGANVILIRDPCWPPVASLGGCLLAAVCWCEPAAEPGSRARSQLWWLRPSPDGGAIVASGRLIEPVGGEGELDEYAPSVGRTSEGAAMLAYLAGPRGKGPAELRLAAITPAGGSAGGSPRVRAGAACRLAAANLPIAPAFSPDGRWLYAVVRSREAGGLTIKRIAVTLPGDHHDAPLALGAASRSGAIGWIGE